MSLRDDYTRAIRSLEAMRQMKAILTEQLTTLEAARPGSSGLALLRIEVLEQQEALTVAIGALEREREAVAQADAARERITRPVDGSAWCETCDSVVHDGREHFLAYPEHKRVKPRIVK